MENLDGVWFDGTFYYKNLGNQIKLSWQQFNHNLEVIKDVSENIGGHIEGAMTAAREALESREAAALSAAEALNSKTASQAAKVSSEEANTSAQTAKIAAETAGGLAETARNAAQTAQAGAETAKSLSESARDAAVTAKDGAVVAKTASESARTTATGAATTATTKAGEASTYAGQALASKNAAGASASNALASENKAKDWATKATAVEGGLYSSKHYAEQAANIIAEGTVVAHEDTAHIQLSGVGSPSSKLKATLTGLGAGAYANIVGLVGDGDIIESGSNENGEYVKFANGTMICLSKSQSIPCATPIGALFRTDSIGQQINPAVFYERPMVIATTSSWRSASAHSTPTWWTGGVTSATSSGSVSIQAFLIGRWKE